MILCGQKLLLMGWCMNHVAMNGYDEKMKSKFVRENSLGIFVIDES